MSHHVGCECAECFTVRACVDDIARVITARCPDEAAWSRVLEHFMGHAAASRSGPRERTARMYLDARARGAFRVYRGVCRTYASEQKAAESRQRGAS